MCRRAFDGHSHRTDINVVATFAKTCVCGSRQGVWEKDAFLHLPAAATDLR